MILYIMYDLSAVFLRGTKNIHTRISDIATHTHTHTTFDQNA